MTSSPASRIASLPALALVATCGLFAACGGPSGTDAGDVTISDTADTTSPVEAGLEWAIQKARRTGGVRAGGFPGAARILSEREHGASRRRVGLKPEGRAPVRAHATIHARDDGSPAIGEITSGGFGPSLDGPMAMGYVPIALSAPGTRLYAEVRGKYLPMQVAPLPFIAPGYRR